MKLHTTEGRYFLIWMVLGIFDRQSSSVSAYRIKDISSPTHNKRKNHSLTFDGAAVIRGPGSSVQLRIRDTYSLAITCIVSTNFISEWRGLLLKTNQKALSLEPSFFSYSLWLMSEAPNCVEEYIFFTVWIYSYVALQLQNFIHPLFNIYNEINIIVNCTL